MSETFAETNLFRVTDEGKYKELAKKLNVDEHWAETKNGAIRHGFKASHSVEYHDENPKNDFMFFVKELQKILPDKEEFFYCEIINGKGYAILCTSHSILNLGVKEKIIYSSPKAVCTENRRTDYAVDIKSADGSFVSQVDVFDTYEEAAHCKETYDEPLLEGQYLSITYIDYDEKGEEVGSGPAD